MPTLMTNSEQMQLTTAAPSLTANSLPYGLRAHSLGVILSGATAGWAGKVTFYGYLKGMWVELSEESVTVSTPTAPTMIWAPLNPMGFERIGFSADTDPGAGALITLAYEPRIRH